MGMQLEEQYDTIRMTEQATTVYAKVQRVKFHSWTLQNTIVLSPDPLSLHMKMELKKNSRGCREGLGM